MPDSSQVLRWANITRRQLDNWVGRGYITPTRVIGQGYGGVQYEWSVAEAKVVQRMAGLAAAGVAPRVAALAARGDRTALEGLLYGLKPCTLQLAWSLTPPPAVAATPMAPEPCL